MGEAEGSFGMISLLCWGRFLSSQAGRLERAVMWCREEGSSQAITRATLGHLVSGMGTGRIVVCISWASVGGRTWSSEAPETAHLCGWGIAYLWWCTASPGSRVQRAYIRGVGLGTLPQGKALFHVTRLLCFSG